MQMNNKTYKLVSTNDPNNTETLDSVTFQDAVEETLRVLQWYIIGEGEHFVAVSDADPNNIIELSEPVYEDAQYELIDKVGYFISSSTDNKD